MEYLSPRGEFLCVRSCVHLCFQFAKPPYVNLTERCANEFGNRPRMSLPRVLFHLDPAGCEYGDHASWCGGIFPGSCYEELHRKHCCVTCPQLADNSNPGRIRHQAFRSSKTSGAQSNGFLDTCTSAHPVVCFVWFWRFLVDEYGKVKERKTR